MKTIYKSNAELKFNALRLLPDEAKTVYRLEYNYGVLKGDALKDITSNSWAQVRKFFEKDEKKWIKKTNKESELRRHIKKRMEDIAKLEEVESESEVSDSEEDSEE